MNLFEKQATTGPRSSRGPVTVALVAIAAGIWTLASDKADSSNRIQISSAPSPHPTGSLHSSNRFDPIVSGALNNIAAESDDNLRARDLEAFIAGISPNEIRSYLESLRHLSADDLTAKALSSLLRRWTLSDAPGAALWIERLPNGPLRDRCLLDVAIEWANSDLENASAWARQLRLPNEQEAALLAIAAEAVRSDPTEALRLTADLPPSPQRDPLITHAAMEWASQDGPAALAWARQISDDSLRQMMLSAIATAWSETDPISAAHTASLEIREGRAQSDAVMGIIARWAQTQPDLAAQWAEQFAPGELRESALDCIEVQKKSEP